MLFNKDISIENCGFKIDQEKNLFRKVQNEYILIQKLKKDIYKMANFGNDVYFMDTFGDCFVIKDTPVFIFGILSQPLYFNVYNNRIYSIDKYSRVWVHDLEGEILNISFLKENIQNVNIRSDYCSVTTDGELVTVDYDFKNEKQNNTVEKKLMIFDRSFELIKCLNIDRVVEYQDSHISIVVDGKAKELSVKDHNARKSLRLENL